MVCFYFCFFILVFLFVVCFLDLNGCQFSFIFFLYFLLYFLENIKMVFGAFSMFFFIWINSQFHIFLSRFGFCRFIEYCRFFVLC